jgi:hypothetical protein
MNNLDFTQLQVLEAKPHVSGSRIGAVVALQGGPIVDFSGNPLGPQPARVVSSLTADALSEAHEANLPVLLVFEDDDPARPVVVDIVIDHPAGVKSRESLPSRRTIAPPGLEAMAAGATIGLAPIVGVEGDAVLVASGTGEPVRAQTSVALRNLKDPVLLLSLADGSSVIFGQIYPNVPIETAGGAGEVLLKGSRVTIQAEVELVLEAGACRVQLDARGKALLSADQIVSRARGANKVQGGNVQLN